MLPLLKTIKQKWESKDLHLFVRLFCLIPKNVCCFTHFLRKFVSKSCYNHQEQVNKVNESLTKLHPDYSAIFFRIVDLQSYEEYQGEKLQWSCDVCCFSYSRQEKHVFSQNWTNKMLLICGGAQLCAVGEGGGWVVVKTNVLFLRLAFGPSSPPPATISQLIHTTTDQHQSVQFVFHRYHLMVFVEKTN